MKIHWWDHPNGHCSCHKNDKGLTAEESYLGKIYWIASQGWITQIGAIACVETFTTLKEAKRHVERLVGGTTVDEDL
jgi:hypothetical protein